MKKRYSTLISFLLIFVATIINISCRKEVELAPKIIKNLGTKASHEKKLKSLDIDSLKKAFYEKNLDQKLIDIIDLGSITWSPDWSSAFYRVKDSSTYLYIPLHPILMKAGSSIKIKLVNQRQFLIVKNNGQFERTIFIGKNNGKKPLLFDYKTLDGSLLVTNLETNKSFMYEYSKGSYINTAINHSLYQANKIGSDMQSFGYELECHTEYTCTFSAGCDGAYYIYTNQTGCEYPDRDFSVGTCSVVNWSLSYRTPHQVCRNVYYPDPPPFPTDPGTGGGGGESGGGSGNLNDITFSGIKDPCLKAALIDAVQSNKNIRGVMSDIIRNLDGNKNITINVVEGQNPNGNAGRNGYSKFDPNTNQFSTTITLQEGYFNGTTYEAVATTLIHEVIHAYLRFNNNDLLNNHNAMSQFYLDPMAQYLQNAYGLSIEDAYGLVWSGIQDSATWMNTNEDDLVPLGRTGI